MPIRTQFEICPVSKDEFYQVDKRVLGLCFDIHNSMGRFLSEEIYQEEIKARCLDSGLEVWREMWIKVSHQDFWKEYFVDLVVNRGVVFETKTSESLTDSHKGQILSYLFLTETNHGSLINLRPERVERQFVSSTLIAEDRRQVKVSEIDWDPIVPEFDQLKDQLLSVLQDWGACLDSRLYRDALTHFLGGEEKVVQEIPIISQSRLLGKQSAHLITPDFAFAVSSLKRKQQATLDHQRRFLQHTNLKAIVWFNLNGTTVELTTIKK